MGSSSDLTKSQHSRACQKLEQEEVKAEEAKKEFGEVEVEEDETDRLVKSRSEGNKKKRPTDSATVSHARRARFQAAGMTQENEAMSKEDVKIDWDLANHDQIQTSPDYGTSESSGSGSLDKRKPKKLREWVKEEPKEGEKKKPHAASKARVAELLFFEEKQRAIEIALAQRRWTDGPCRWTKTRPGRGGGEGKQPPPRKKEVLLAKSCSEKKKGKPPEVVLKPNETFVGPIDPPGMAWPKKRCGTSSSSTKGSAERA